VAFKGEQFVFGGVPSEEFGLLMYEPSGGGQESFKMPFPGSANTAHAANGFRNFLYNREQASPLIFKLAVCADPYCAGDATAFFDRYDVDAIMQWLTGEDEYRWLHILQPDTDLFRFRCVVTDVELVTWDGSPWAVNVTFQCDSPYAYWLPQRFSATSTTAATRLTIHSKSSAPGYYRPRVKLTTTSGTDILIVNESDNGSEFRLTNLPQGLTLNIDGEKCLIESSDGINRYAEFNMQFLRLKRGENKLAITGNAAIEIVCEFPANIGG